MRIRHRLPIHVLSIVLALTPVWSAAAPSSPCRQDRLQPEGLQRLGKEIHDLVTPDPKQCLTKVSDLSRQLMHLISIDLNARYILTLSGPLLTRIHAHITTPDQPQSIPLEWDPIDGRSMSRAISLPTDRSWCVTFSGEAFSASSTQTTGGTQSQMLLPQFIGGRDQAYLGPPGAADISGRFANFLAADRLIVKLDETRKACEKEMQLPRPTQNHVEGSSGDEQQPEDSASMPQVNAQQLVWFQSSGLAKTLVEQIVKTMLARIANGLDGPSAKVVIPMVQSFMATLLENRGWLYDKYSLNGVFDQNLLMRDLGEPITFLRNLTSLCSNQEKRPPSQLCDSLPPPIVTKLLERFSGDNANLANAEITKRLKEIFHDKAWEKELETGLDLQEEVFRQQIAEDRDLLADRLEVTDNSEEIGEAILRIHSYAVGFVRSLQTQDRDFCDRGKPDPAAPASCSEPDPIKGYFGEVTRPTSPAGDKPQFTISITRSAPPSLADAATSIQAQEPIGGPRSLAASIASDALQILAEIAFERAKSKTLSLLSEKIADWVCEDLKVPKELAVGLLTSEEEQSPRSPQLLPQTCLALRNLRIQELMASARTILHALTTDIARRSINKIKHTLVQATGDSRNNGLQDIGRQFEPTLRMATELTLRNVQGETTQAQEAQLLFLSFARDFQKLAKRAIDGKGIEFEDPEQSTKLRLAACSVQLAFAILSECSNSSAGRCDARHIDDLIAQATRFFNMNLACRTLFDDKGPQHAWKDLKPFVSRALVLLAPGRSMTPHQQVRTALDLIFEVAEHIYGDDVLASSRRKDAIQSSTRIVRVLHMLHTAMQALLSQDAQGSLLALIKLFEVSLDESDQKKVEETEAYKTAKKAWGQRMAQFDLLKARASESNLRFAIMFLESKRSNANRQLDAAKKRVEDARQTLATHLTNKSATREQTGKAQDAVTEASNDEAEWKSQSVLLGKEIRKRIAEMRQRRWLPAAATNADVEKSAPQAKAAEEILQQKLNRWIEDPTTNPERTVEQAQQELAAEWEKQLASAMNELATASQELDQAVSSELGKLNTPSRKLRHALVRATQVLAAVSSYAQHYSAEQDPQQMQAERAARKKAIESLIDQATTRNHRQGDWIWSLGANVGFTVGWQRSHRKVPNPDPMSMAPAFASHEELMTPQLGLPMGLAVQRLPSGAASGFCGRFGWHMQLSPIDLGQFLAYTGDGGINIDWPNFFVVGGQAGLLISFSRRSRSPDLINVGVDVRYAPGLRFAEDPGPRGVARIGFYVSYYVPFFDFN